MFSRYGVLFFLCLSLRVLGLWSWVLNLRSWKVVFFPSLLLRHLYLETVIRNNTPRPGMHVSLAYLRILPSKILHWPMLKGPHWGTAFVYWYVEAALSRAFAGLPEAVIAAYRLPLWHPILFLRYTASSAWFWMHCKKVKLIICNNIGRKRLKIWELLSDKGGPIIIPSVFQVFRTWKV